MIERKNGLNLSSIINFIQTIHVKEARAFIPLIIFDILFVLSIYFFSFDKRNLFCKLNVEKRILFFIFEKSLQHHPLSKIVLPILMTSLLKISFFSSYGISHSLEISMQRVLILSSIVLLGYYQNKITKKKSKSSVKFNILTLNILHFVHLKH